MSRLPITLWLGALALGGASLAAPAAARAQGGSPGLAGLAGPPGRYDRFGHILIDSLGNRGGNGDVAAGFVFARELVERHHYKGRVTIAVETRDQPSRNGGTQRAGLTILRRIVPGFEEFFGGRVQLALFENGYVAEGQAPVPRADLYLSFAGVNGDPSLPYQWSRDDLAAVAAGDGSGRGVWRPGSPIDDATYLFSFPVLGNTENQDSRFRFAQGALGDRTLILSPPGLGPGENGIYYDTSAAELRGASRPEAAAYLRARLPGIPSAPTRALLEQLTSAGALRRMRIGFAYGISLGEVRPQFASYLEGLARTFAASSRPIVLLTPSSVWEGGVPGTLRRRVSFGTPEEGIPADLGPGRIHIIRIPAVPNDVFNSLLALSEVPPIVAGDNALSAAILLGRPFVMTQVEWNRRNVRMLVDRLLAHPSVAGRREAARIGERLAAGDLSVAAELAGFRDAYRALAGSIPWLSDRVLEAVEVFEGARADLGADPALEISATLSRLVAEGRDEELARAAERWAEDPLYIDVVYRILRRLPFGGADGAGFGRSLSLLIRLADRKEDRDFFKYSGELGVFRSERARELRPQARAFIRAAAKWADYPYLPSDEGFFRPEDRGFFAAEIRLLHALQLKKLQASRAAGDARAFRYHSESPFHRRTPPEAEEQLLGYLRGLLAELERDPYAALGGPERQWKELFQGGSYSRGPHHAPSPELVDRLIVMLSRRSGEQLLLSFGPAFFAEHPAGYLPQLAHWFDAIDLTRRAPLSAEELAAIRKLLDSPLKNDPASLSLLEERIAGLAAPAPAWDERCAWRFRSLGKRLGAR